ncbi:MAG: glycosyltransferase family 2 protein [Chitinophagales bacterium]|nr:glycosyltransferase family 2 protein [Chitinophagales bacterium]
MKLCIVIPALNEEESIEKIIIRSLDAKAHIIQNSDVTSVDITVVSDGSTDRTVELAQKYQDKIHLIVFPQNKGYGAAIKQGWLESDAGLLGFLDSDGTCNPLFFADLCNLITKEKSDVALGCRINKNSKMPLIRRIGNGLFSILLTYLASEKVKDTASGMRVVKRSALPELMPLPDGLHFTPAMSARALLSEQIKIREKDMPYEERDGESKLHIWKDGLRFLRVIIETSILYRPNRLLGLVASFLALFALALMASPIINYIKFRMVEDLMIYRLIVCNLLGITSFLFFSAAFITEKVVGMTVSRTSLDSVRQSLLSKIYSSGYIWWVPVFGTLLGILLIGDSLYNRFLMGETYEHWSRYVAMSFFISIAFITLATKSIAHVLKLISERLDYMQSNEYNRFK